MITLLLHACGGGGSGSEGTKLSWTPPATRVDGSYLGYESIAGFRIYYGSEETELTLMLDIGDGTIYSTSVNTPDEGEYYYAITAYNNYNLESELSNIIKK
jgi:fibronectin type 3 domain-containing protein